MWTQFSLNEHERMHFIYLVLLIVLLAIRIFRNSTYGILRALKMSIMWLVILMSLLVLYHYRSAAYSILKAQLFPSSPTLQYGDTAIEVHRAMNGHFMLDARVNGIPVRFMIDTGASDVVIPYSLALKAGLKPHEILFTDSIITANGRAFAAKGYVDLEISNLAFRAVPVLITEQEDTMLLGMSLLNKFKSINISEDALIMQP